jgi:hypothetical protein
VPASRQPAKSTPPARLPARLLAALVAFASAAAAEGAPYLGRPLDEVLRELSSEGLHLVYSNELVPPSLRVTREPAPGAPVQVLEELLAQHGLAARPVGKDTFAIVKADRPTAPVVAASAPADTAPLEEVVVAASRYSLSAEVPDAHTFFTHDEIEGLPRLADDSLKAVHRLPAAASNGVSGLANMRGGENTETLVVLDGFPLYEPFHLKVLLSPTSLLDPDILSGVDVHAGGFTAEYGDRMSAVIDATSIHPDDDQYAIGLSLFNASLLAVNRFDEGRGQWLVAARASDLDQVGNLVDAEYSALRYSDAFARLDYAFTPSTRASLHVLLSKDHANVTNSQETEASDARYRNSYLWGTLSHDFSPALSASAIASYTYVSTTRKGEVDDAGVRTGLADDHRHYDVLGLKLDASYRSERWLTRFGAELRSLDASYDYSSFVRFEANYPFPGDPVTTKVVDLSPKPSGAHYALYATTRVRLAAPLTAEFGLRWDDETYTPDGNDQFGPRINLVYQATPTTRLRASWGTYQQSQAINELQVEDGIDRFFRPQRAYHQIVGLEQGLPSGFTLRIEGYRKDYSNLKPRFESLYDPTSIVPELRWDRIEIAPHSARAEGAEFLLTRKSSSPWNGWLNYTWSKVYDRENGTDTPRSWDQRNNIGGGLTWTDGPWQATLAGTYHTGWPTTPVRLVGSVPGEPTVVVGPRNAARLQAFASVDLRISRDFALPRGTLNVFAEATNLLSRSNPCCVDFGYDTAEDGTVELDRQYRNWLPLVTNVGVLWRF